MRLEVPIVHIAQSVEHFLGKEEVTGSIPVMGSRILYVGWLNGKGFYCLTCINVEGKVEQHDVKGKI